MDKKEKELEDMIDDMEKTNMVVPPLFEIYATVFSIAVTIILFTFPGMIYNYPANLYDHMMAIMPQYWWGFTFFIACMLKAIGLMLDYDWLRIVGLVASAILYALLTICYAIDFPTIGALTFGCMTAFAVVSVPFVKHTSIRTKG